MTDFPLYKTLMVSIVDKDLTVLQKNDFMEKITKIDLTDRELVCALINSYSLEHEKKQELVPYNGSIYKNYLEFNLLQFPYKLRQLIYKFLIKITEKQQEDKEMEDVKEAILTEATSD